MKRWNTILRRIKDDDVIAEIGVWKGNNSRNILEGNSTVKLYLIDRWSVYSKLEAKREGSLHMPSVSRGKFKIAKNKTYLNVEQFKDRVEIIENGSIEASKQFEDGFFDLVFIDALHSYEGCIADIKAWLPKVKKGGYIGGHDYPRRSGVVKAVQEMFRENVETDSDDTWFVRI